MHCTCVSLTFTQRRHISFVAQTVQTLQTDFGRSAVPTSDKSQDACGGRRAKQRTPFVFLSLICSPKFVGQTVQTLQTIMRTQISVMSHGLTNTAPALPADAEVRQTDVGDLDASNEKTNISRA